MAICNVTGKLTAIGGAPIVGESVAWRLDAAPGSVQFADGAAIGRNEIVSKTDENGVFSVSLVQGAKLMVHIEVLGLYRRVTIPAQAAATLEEVLNADV